MMLPPREVLRAVTVGRALTLTRFPKVLRDPE
jgi:hypothetical protein